MATLNITKSYEDGTVFFEVDLDNIADAMTAFLNTTKVNSDNIQTEGVNISRINSDLVDNVTLKKTTSGVAINEDGVVTAHIIDGSVETDHIVALNVTTAKIVDNAVTTAKIADATLVASDFINNAVTTAKIASSAVTTAKIASAAVTADKLASTSNERDWALELMSDTSLNQIGTYRILHWGSATTITAGDTVLGSQLFDYSPSATSFVTSSTNANLGSTVSGTWRYFGASPLSATGGGAGSYPAGLFLRIS